MHQEQRVKRELVDRVELKVEKSLIQILEDKYQEVAQQLDKSEMLQQRAEFECDVAKKEK